MDQRIRIRLSVAGIFLAGLLAYAHAQENSVNPALVIPEPAPTVAVPASPVPEPAPTVAAPASPVPEPTPTEAAPAVPLAEPAPTVAAPAGPVPEPAPTVAAPASPVPEPAPTVAAPAGPVPEPAPTVAAPAGPVPETTPLIAAPEKPPEDPSVGGVSAPEDKPKETPKQEQTASDSKMSFGGGLAVGYVTKDNQNVTRIAFRPELSIGSLGIALDLEIFLNQNGQIMRDGWEFNSRDKTINSLYRKLYYIRWNHPGDGFYVRVGALEGINMDAAGLITSNWGNVANYPSQKLVGVHVQLNDWFNPFGVSLEVANNSVEDWHHKGGVLMGKASFRPFGASGLPFTSALRIGGVVATDHNQLAAVRDSDGDNCPDDLDFVRGDGCRNLLHYMDGNVLDTIQGNNFEIYREQARARRNVEESRIVDRFAHEDKFTLLGLDASFPIITTQPLSFSLYAGYARPLVRFDQYNLNKSWGLVPIGAALRFLILDAGLEYRVLKGRFQPGHFDGNYEAERARYVGSEYLTKEQVYWEMTDDQGRRQGIYGRASLDLGGFIVVGGSYSHLIAQSGPSDRSFKSKAGLGETVLNFIPKINLAEVYYNKTRVGAENEAFLERSIFANHGYRVGFELGGAMTIVVSNNTLYTRTTDGKLEPVTNFKAETIVVF